MESSGLSIDSTKDLTPVLQIITWLLQCLSVLAVLVKIGTKLRIIHDFSQDDIAILVALAFSTGQCVAASLQNANGFGQHRVALGEGRIQAALKSQYAAQLLLILSLCCAKLSVAAFVQNLTPNKSDRRMIAALMTLIAVWSLGSLLAAAFQCRVPAPWNFLGEYCFNRTAFWNSFGILNVVTDVGLIAMPLKIIICIQASLRKRFIISLCFLTRVVVIAATICQIIYWDRSSHSTDLTFDEWPVVICTQALLSASIITACVPQFKRLLDCLESGMLGTDDLRRRGQTGLYGYTGHSGKNQSKAYYMLEPRSTNSNGKTDPKLNETGPSQWIRTGPGDISLQERGDEESQRSTSRMVKGPDSTASLGM